MLNKCRRYEVSDSEWEILKDLLPPKRGKPGRPSDLNGILWIVRSGTPWQDLPEHYDSWSTSNL